MKNSQFKKRIPKGIRRGAPCQSRPHVNTIQV